MVKIVINAERCKGCGLCLEVCPNKVLRMSSAFNSLGSHFVEVEREEACTGCCRCAIICPDVVFELYRTEEAGSASQTGGSDEDRRNP